MRPLGASAMELVIAAMSSTPFAPRIRPSVSSFRRQRRRAGINRDDRSGPAEFVHSFAQRTWADELADDIRHRRSKGEAAIGRSKRVIGDALYT
jgi:hypothetical protein